MKDLRRIARFLVHETQEHLHEAAGQILFETIAASGESNCSWPAKGLRVCDIDFLIRKGRKSPVTVRVQATWGLFPYGVDDETPVRIWGIQFTTWGELCRYARNNERPRDRDTPPLMTEKQLIPCNEDDDLIAVASFSLAPWNTAPECANG